MNDSVIWYFAAAIAFLAVGILGRKVEHDYCKIFAANPTSNYKNILSLIVVSFVLAIVVWISREQIPPSAAVALAIAAASLHGIFKIDRMFLVIPDRLQIAGFVGGVLFVLCLGLSGEDIRDVGFERLFALAMVALLWGLSYIYLRVRGTIGFGFGDVKLLGWLALIVGKGMPDLILIAIGLGLIQIAINAAVNTAKNRKISLPKAHDAFAFAPAIVTAWFVEEIIRYV